jgi:membrane protein
MAGSGSGGVRSVVARLPPRIREHNLTLVAAGVAFYAFLALVPALIAFISIYGLVADPTDVTRQVEDIASALPAEVQDFLVFQLTSIVEANAAGVSVTLLIAVVLALWSASGGMAALITGIHVAHERDEPKSCRGSRKHVQRRSLNLHSPESPGWA